MYAKGTEVEVFVRQTVYYASPSRWVKARVRSCDTQGGAVYYDLTLIDLSPGRLMNGVPADNVRSIGA